MSGGFRRLLGRRETARFKSFMLAIALQMFGLIWLQKIVLTEVWIPSFSPVGVTVGGLLFGMAMGWSGGCPAGIWYKLGGGNVSVWVSLFGAVTGFVAMESGGLKGVRISLQSIGSSTQGKGMTLHSLLGISDIWLALPISLVLLFVLLRGAKPAQTNAWSWRRTGLWMGLIGLLAWLSSTLSNRHFGMSLFNGSKDIFSIFSDLSVFFRWEFYFVLGVPIGGFFAARQTSSFAWVGLKGPDAWKRLGGGLLLGFSASLAGGCTIGHGLTGIPLLSIGSILFIFFAILGTWLAEGLENRLALSE